ncbi:MarR family transcriptional regulator [Intrasporangium sp.]|uniref:MarR family winged helix-turn-helix transcriptional regulator n=1 Tax=Intrasporangium sp. TaxID=1925024 RepID=UPI003221E37F
MAAKPRSLAEGHHQAVALYVAAGGEETVQRVITALYAVTKRLDQWYARQLADLDLTQGEWAVLTGLATARDECLTPSQLADASSVAPSSMTHRLDKMAARGLVARRPDPTNRTRTLVSLTPDGWELFSQSTRESNVVESDTLRDLDEAERVELARLLEVVLTGLDGTVEAPVVRRG